MNLLNWLQNWYTQYCDGDWEHAERIKIQTLDNPGWRLNVNLEDTEYENKEFTTIKDFRTEDDWIVCRIRDGRFDACGGSLNLEEIIKVFHDWILS